MSQPVLTLASTSPRRKQLLEMLGIPIEIKPSHVPEVRLPGEDPIAYVRRLAHAKARSVQGQYVLGADTTVILGREILEKPADAEDAFRMLRKLAGRTHEVATAVALFRGGQLYEAVDISKVHFRGADDAFLRAYVATGEPMDKAGAYGIQGYGAALVDRIEGDFFGIMGLPVRKVLDLLADAGWPYRFGQPG